jgi:hypothetical protein
MCRYTALANVRSPITDSGRMAVSGHSFMATGGQNPMSADSRSGSRLKALDVQALGPEEGLEIHVSASRHRCYPAAQCPQTPIEKSLDQVPCGVIDHLTPDRRVRPWRSLGA